MSQGLNATVISKQYPRRLLDCFFLFLAFWMAVGPVRTARAQVGSTLAQLNGSVRDESGGSVGKATVTLRDVNTNQSYTATSTDSGFYLVPNITPGQFELTLEYSGFSKYTQTGIALRVGQTATIDVTLKVASTGANIVVTNEAPLVEPTRTEISQVIETNQIQSLPISGRLFTDFALLTPGVATGRTSLQSTFTEFETTRISFGGMRDLSNAVTVDGADTINTATGSQRATPPQEAVSEFRVVNNSFGSEYGRALGGIVNIITKSGTNNLHGSVYDYLQNNAVDARSLLQPAPQANALRQNQFGATLGGPIKKDRTFFFMNYEGQRRGESPTYPELLVSNLTQINAAKAYLGIAPENLNILKTRDTDNGIVKLDHEINKNNRLSVRYNIFDARELNLLVGDTLDGGGIGAPSSGHNAFIRDQSAVASITTQLGPALVNSALVQYGRRHNTFPGTTGQPNLDIPNTLLFGHNFGTFDATYESRVQASDSLAWVKGAHFAKFGVDFNHIDNFVIWPGFNPMRIILPFPNCMIDFANFVDSTNINNNIDPKLGQLNNQPPCPLPPFFNGVPIVFWGAPIGTAPAPSLPTPPVICPSTGCVPDSWKDIYYNSTFPALAQDFFVQFNHSYYGFFAQDQWRVTPKLTLNYGLRYDFEAGLSRQINPDYRGIQPRVGLAYSLDKHTVIRAGFGIFDDRFNLTFAFVTFPQRPSALPGSNVPPGRVGSDTATWTLNQLPFGFPGHPDPSVVAKNLLTKGTFEPNSLALPSTVGGTGLDHNSRIPYSEQASLEIDREIGKGLAVNVGYLFVAAHKLVRPENLNVCPSAGISSGPYTCPSAYQAFLSHTNAGVLPVAPDNTIALPGLQGIKPAFSGPLYPSGLLYYLDDSGNSVYHGITLSVIERAGNYLRLNANYTFSKTLDDGTFTTFVSTPQNLYDRPGERANSNQDIRHRFVANFVADGPKKTLLRNSEFSSIITVQSARPFTMFFGADGNGDTNPVTDRVGLSTRNAYWGDNLATWDLRVTQFIKVHEQQKIEVALDVFNALNRANVNEVTSVYGAPIFISGTPNHYKDGITSPANPGFGSPRTMFNPRQLQLSLKYSF